MDTSNGIEFVIVPLIIAAAFVALFGVILARVTGGVMRWNHDNQQAPVTVPATVVAKRVHFNDTSGSRATTYFVAFEIKSGERLEFGVAGPVYGTLVEGDDGQLSYQGSRFEGFDRIPRDR